MTKTVALFLLSALLACGAAAQTASRHAPRHKPAHHVELVVVYPPPVPLGPAELELAQRVYVGRLPCELGASVTLEAHASAAGYFNLHFGKQTFVMAPVPTSTGAIRLEDHYAGATWLQLANKSMLVSDKLGKRLVDACMNPDQVQTAEQMRRNPVRSVLDDPAPADGALAAK